jgi:hypothetical protein
MYKLGKTMSVFTPKLKASARQKNGRRLCSWVSQKRSAFMPCPQVQRLAAQKRA